MRLLCAAVNCWLGSPNAGNANNVRNVHRDTGALNNNNAYNGNSAALDCEEPHGPAYKVSES